jgi:hypothetical protein
LLKIERKGIGLTISDGVSTIEVSKPDDIRVVILRFETILEEILTSFRTKGKI